MKITDKTVKFEILDYVIFIATALLGVAYEGLFRGFVIIMFTAILYVLTIIAYELHRLNQKYKGGAK